MKNMEKFVKKCYNYFNRKEGEPFMNELCALQEFSIAKEKTDTSGIFSLAKRFLICLFELRKLKIEFKKIDYKHIDHINKKAFIKDTRISTETIFEQYLITGTKDNIEEKLKKINASFNNLTREEICEAVLYYVAHTGYFILLRQFQYEDIA